MLCVSVCASDQNGILLSGKIPQLYFDWEVGDWGNEFHPKMVPAKSSPRKKGIQNDYTTLKR